MSCALCPGLAQAAIEYDSCALLLEMPQPLTVVLDFERETILFAMAPGDVGSWPVVSPPRAKATYGQTSFDRSISDTAGRIRALPREVRWIDVTATYQDIAERIFATIGPLYCKRIEASGKSLCALDSWNCHDVTSLACLSRSRDYISHLTMAEEGLVEIDPAYRKFARVSVILDIKDEKRITSFHSMVHLAGTEWVIHKEGFGQTRLNAMHVDEAARPYRGHRFPTVPRYFADVGVAKSIAVHLAFRRQRAKGIQPNSRPQR